MSKGVASNGKPFLTLLLGDATGEIEAKLWDASEEDEALFIQERIVKVEGEIIQFRGQLQLKIISIRIDQQANGLSVGDFVKKAPVEKEKLYEQITEAIFEMQNPTIQRIVRAFVQKYKEELLTYPAATKNHHDYVSGLAHHTVTMLSLAKAICDIYPQLNKDLLYAGVILHDLGKITELSGLVSTQYTLKGKLLGHITIMVAEIEQMAEKLKVSDEEEVLVLQHLVLAHHGQAEWGSPKPPLVLEAEILHFIDLIDAKMNMATKALAKTEPGEFTERLFAMNQRSFYKPTFEKD